MALCPKCYVGAIVQGTGLMPAEARFRLEFELRAEPGGPVDGVRSVVFEGEVTEGHPTDGGGSIEGVLVGNFGPLAEEDLELPATVETFTRRGGLAHVMVTASNDTGRVVFSAGFTPAADSDGATLEGSAFLGWPAEPARED